MEHEPDEIPSGRRTTRPAPFAGPGMKETPVVERSELNLGINLQSGFEH